MDIGERVLFEDNHIIIINKLPGEIVQGDKTGDEPLVETVKRYLKEKYQKPGNVFCGVVHRIDRPVSGAVIFAKTSKALARLNAIVKDRKINKTYWALVSPPPTLPQAHLSDYLYRNEKQNKSYISATIKAGYVQAELSYHVVRPLAHYTLIEVALYTGRHHQIRAQLAAHGMHIKGDLKYGAKRSNSDGSISLHARRVAFEHPVTHEQIEVIAPLRGEFQRIVEG